MGCSCARDVVDSVPFTSISEGCGGKERLGAGPDESPPARVEEP